MYNLCQASTINFHRLQPLCQWIDATKCSFNCTVNMEKAINGVTYLAVWAVRGVLMACSIVPGRPLCVPGLTNPLTGRPAWDMGLEEKSAWYYYLGYDGKCKYKNIGIGKHCGWTQTTTLLNILPDSWSRCSMSSTCTWFFQRRPRTFVGQNDKTRISHQKCFSKIQNWECCLELGAKYFTLEISSFPFF